MGTSKRTRRIGVLAAVLFALVAAACGGADSDAAPTDDPGDAANQRAEEAAAAERFADGRGVVASNLGRFFSGDGDGVVVFQASGGLTVLDLGHAGAGAFSVGLERSGSNDGAELVVERQGEWSGSIGLGLPAGEVRLRIAADGVWFAVVREPQDEPAIAAGQYKGVRKSQGRWQEELFVRSRQTKEDGEFAFSESRWSVTPPFPLGGEGDAQFFFFDEMEFHVWLIDEAGERVTTLLSGIGGPTQSDAFSVPAGVYRAVVQADGSWALVIRPG